MLRALPYILLSIIVYLVLFYLQNYQPELLKNIIVTVDVLDISPTAKIEHQRLSAINQLTIPYEQKQVLINGTVFIGCSGDMVKLALGEPQKTIPDPPSGRVYFIYYLIGDKRPTVLVLGKDGLLENAYKGSALDMHN